jgi:hydrogenase nickel incorporation protein HypA/HybF
MHELSLAGGVLRLVEQAAARDRFRRVQRLVLEAGALSGVEVRSLRFAIESLAPGTCLEGCELQIDEPPGQAWCLACSHSVPLAARGQACPLCGSHQLQPTGGTELRVLELLVDDDVVDGTQP